MKLKLWSLLAGFISLYFLVHIANHLPGIVNGQPLRYVMPSQPVTDITASFLFALLPYLVLFRWYPSGRHLWVFAGIMGLVAVVFYLNFFIYQFTSSGTVRLRHFFLQNLFFFAMYVLYGITFYFIRFSHYKELQRKELLLQNRQSELSFLRSQINPHFLFNSLNNIYSLVYDRSPQALPAIAGLSELLRYMLYDTMEKVPLDKELDYIHQYIELQKLRFDHPINAGIVISGQTDTINIPPLILVPFVENAFKHGDFTGPQEGLNLFIESSAGKTRFHCYNKKNNSPKDAGGGIGLNNVKRRLELLYSGKHRLDIRDEAHSFTVNLELTHE